MSLLYTPLSEVPLGRKAKISQILCEREYKRRLLDLGLAENTYVVPLFRSIGGGLTAYAVRGSVIAVRKENANQIMIKK